jgi:hypothetical protein
MGIVDDFWRMIPLRIGTLGHDERTPGAELDTEAASLAPFFDDVNDAMGHLDAVPI